MIKVTLKDGSVKELESACSVFDVAKEISPRLAKAACVAKIDGEIKDLRLPRVHHGAGKRLSDRLR